MNMRDRVQQAYGGKTSSDGKDGGTGKSAEEGAGRPRQARRGVEGPALVKTGPAYTNLGEEIVFTIVVTNVGTVPAHNVTVTDPVPPGLSFVSNAGACTTPFPCLLGTLAPGASRTISVTLLVAADYDGPDVIINTATVTSTSTTESSSSSAAVPLMLNPYLVPANSNWTLALMALAMLLLGAGTLRRRF